MKSICCAPPVCQEELAAFPGPSHLIFPTALDVDIVIPSLCTWSLGFRLDVCPAELTQIVIGWFSCYTRKWYIMCTILLCDNLYESLAKSCHLIELNGAHTGHVMLTPNTQFCCVSDWLILCLTLGP